MWAFCHKWQLRRPLGPVPLVSVWLFNGCSVSAYDALHALAYPMRRCWRRISSACEFVVELVERQRRSESAPSPSARRRVLEQEQHELNTTKLNVSVSVTLASVDSSTVSSQSSRARPTTSSRSALRPTTKWTERRHQVLLIPNQRCRRCREQDTIESGSRRRQQRRGRD
jgi:hypothetical protein